MPTDAHSYTFAANTFTWPTTLSAGTDVYVCTVFYFNKLTGIQNS